MVKCTKCGEYKEPSLRYWRSNGQAGCWAGSSCPKCETHRCGIEKEPDWWAPLFNPPVKPGTRI